MKIKSVCAALAGATSMLQQMNAIDVDINLNQDKIVIQVDANTFDSILDADTLTLNAGQCNARYKHSMGVIIVCIDQIPLLNTPSRSLSIISPLLR